MNKSFTLIETIVVISIFALIITVTAGLIVHFYKTYAYVFRQSTAINEARKGLKTMVREIREAGVGEDGSYPIESANDCEFVFFSDIDRDNEVERVRYFLSGLSSKEEIKTCASFNSGGSCSVDFSNFYEGELKEAKIEVSIEGDFGWSLENAEIRTDDGTILGKLCDGSDCSDCAGQWQGTKIFDVKDIAQDNFIQFTADASYYVGPYCDWQENNHSILARFKLTWTQEIPGHKVEFSKGVVNPVGWPPKYFIGQEETTILSQYVQNKVDNPEKFVFRYLNKDGEEIQDYPARAEDTRMIEISLIIDADPNSLPKEFDLRTYVQLRNLKTD
ncbi:MAG: type II secretion system protein [Patescibacteria group bacterium]|nr:type II secretion system protein [Patescibacteria group bacterium]